MDRVRPEVLGSQPPGPLQREAPQRAPDDPRQARKTDEASIPAYGLDRPSLQAPENNVDFHQAEQFRAFDLVEKHSRPAVPLALHHHRGDGMRMQVQARPWKRQIGGSQFRPFPAREGDRFYPDGAPSDRRAPQFAGHGDRRNVDGPVSRDHMGLLAEMNDVAHPPTVERNGRPGELRAQRATRLSENGMTMPGASCRVCSVAQFNGLGMAPVTGIEQCLTLPSKTIGTNYGKP